MSNETKCANPSCGKKIKQTKGKRARKYCNSTCRSSHFQKKQRAEVSVKKTFVEQCEEQAKKDFVKLGVDVVMAGSPTNGMYDGPKLNISHDEWFPKNKTTVPIDLVRNHSVGIQSKTTKQAKEKFERMKKKPPVTIQDLTKPSVIEPKSSPQTNYSIDTHPKNLKELKALCPASLRGLDRSAWISENRKKFSV